MQGVDFGVGVWLVHVLTPLTWIGNMPLAEYSSSPRLLTTSVEKTEEANPEIAPEIANLLWSHRPTCQERVTPSG